MRRSSVIVLAFVAAWSSFPAARADDAEQNLMRLKAMSRADRERMAKAIEVFDALDSPKRDAVRELNDQLAALDPESRARYLVIMRRYHVFYQTLSPEKRRALDSEPDSAKKLALIATYRAERKDELLPLKELSDWLQVSTLTMGRQGPNPMLRLRGVARHLIVYFSLDPVNDAEMRAKFARTKAFSEREALIRELLPLRSPAVRPELREKLREENEEFRAAEETVRKNPELAKRFALGQSEGAKSSVQAKKSGASNAKATDSKSDEAETKQKQREQLVRVLDEKQVIHEMDAEVVPQANLNRFDAALPPWARESLDQLPPTAARRRLKALYRLVFPSPQEMPIPKNTAPPKAKRPAATAPGGANPF